MGEKADNPSPEEYERLRAENERLLESLREAYERERAARWKEQRFRSNVKEVVVTLLVLGLLALLAAWIYSDGYRDDRVPEQRCPFSAC